jgi:hypothetical protein
MKLSNTAMGAIASLVIAGSSFSKKETLRTYDYVSGTDYQRLAPGHTTESDLRERTINSAAFTDVSNWTIIPQSYTQTSDHSKYIGSVTFDEEATADGGSDGQVTLQEALNAVYYEYYTPNPDDMPYIVWVNGTAVVTITAANAVH